MELVYLWVEKYKNIKEQGFNFSPRFECEYKDEKLTITPKEHIENFFDEKGKINVTAIVGENGSGKSGILEFLRFALKKDTDNEKYKSLILFYDKRTTKYTLLNLLGKKIQTIPIIAQKCYQGINSFEKVLSKTIFPTFDYSLTYNLLDYNKDKNRDIKIHFPFYPNKTITIYLKEEIINNQKNILVNYMTLKEKNQLNKFEKFFQPNVINIYFDLSTMSPNKNCKLIDDKEEEYNTLKSDIQKELGIIEIIEIIDKLFKLLSDQSSYDDSVEDLDFENDIQFCNYDNFKLARYDRLEIELYNIFDKYRDKDILLNKSELKRIHLKNELDLLLSFKIDALNKEDIEVIMASFSSRQFKIELIDKNNKKLNDLSFGEQQLLNFLNSLYYLGSKEYPFLDVNDDTHFKEINNFIVFFDEIELGLHPNWQKKTVNYILDFLKLIPDRNFHLILASHSPFLISDLPKENVIFLKDGKQVEGTEKKQTFGANIHTLLSDGFFMQGGLMGEFAKVKIDEAIEYLNKDKLDDKELKYCEQIISIIGEPIVKNQLQRMLDSKRLSKIDTINEKIKNMAYELEILKEYQSKIIKDELSDKGKKRYKERFIDDKNSK